MKKSIVGISILMLLILAACNSGGGTIKTPSTDSTNTSSTVAVDNDSTMMKKEDAEKMIKDIQDSLKKLEVENTNLKKNPPKHQNVTFPSVKTPYMIAIDWEWNNPNPPAQLRCLGYVVSGDGPVKLRGNATAHDCVVNAIQAYRQDRLDGAISWLCAGQCHNGAAQQDIRNGGQMAAQYAEQTFGMNVHE